MKKLFLNILLLLFFVAPSAAQSRLYQVLKEHYRVNPFTGNFSSFVKALANDPDLLDKKLLQKSDSTNYFLRGEYKIFNPFNQDANKIEMIFTEQAIELERNSSLQHQTVYTYQILAYFDDNEATRKTAVKNYNKIKKQLQKEMGVEISTLKNFKDIEDGEISHFFFVNSSIYPVTLSWQTLAKSKQVALTLVTRLLVANNKTYIAAGIYDSN